MNDAPITNLDALPSNTVQARGPIEVARLAQLTAASGHRWAHVDVLLAVDRAALFRAIGNALALPEWFGANLDALYDSLRDLIDAAGAPGFVIVLEHLRRARAIDTQQRAALLDVFRDAAELAADRGVAWRVFYD